MFPVHKELKGITHPQIASLYLRRDYTDGHGEEDILVIETIAHDDSDHEMNGRDEYIMDLLMDLENLKREVERRAGVFSRVDIRCH
jgi:hypothetical protein